MGTVATMAYEGRITGGGPSDPKLRTELLNTGWQPYSFVLPHPDGTLSYVKFGRFDPIAMPFGMMADIMDVAKHPDPVLASKAKGMAEAMATGMLKSLTDKLYLQNLNHTIEAISDPDKAGWKTAGGYVENYVPLSSALRAGNPDPYMREARTFLDKIKMSLPGFSEDVPAKRDFAGDPVTAHKGIWLTDKGSQVDHEMNRMSLEQGVTIGPPPPSAHGGTDLRTIQMQDGSNAYDRLQELSAQPVPGMPRLKEALGNLINTDAYKNAPDGASNDRGTKPAMLLDQIGRYRNAASKIVSADPNVRKAEYDRQMKTAAAYSSKNANPSPGNQTSQMLDTLGKQFGVDMHGLAGGSGAPTPSPLPPGARPITQ